MPPERQFVDDGISGATLARPALDRLRDLAAVGAIDRMRSLCVQGQQLLPKGEVLQEEFFSGTKGGDNPTEQMSQAHKHLGMIAKTAPGRCTSNSLILR